MTAHKYFGLALLAASSPLALMASPVHAQTRSPGAQPNTQNRAQSNPDNPLEDEPAIVVTGQRERGAVMGDVKPLQQFDAGDIRALGVSNINELLTELGPQVQSASGKPPVMLLEGQRMSSPLEIASLPSEAIARVDVLPEEVGLRYGYGADQKVVNIVLRERFRATNVELDGRIPTAGGSNRGQAEVGFLSIRNGRRFNIGAELTGQESLLETERGLTSDNSPYRTLLPSERQLTINTTYKMPIAERMSASLNGQLVTSQQDAEIGYNGATGALERTTNRLTTHGGFTITRDRAKGQLSLTGNYDHGFTRTISEQNPVSKPSEVSRSTTDTASLDLLYSTPLAQLPSGDLALTGHLTGSTQSFKSSRVRDLATTATKLTRSSGGGSVNLNIPIAGMGTPLSRTIGNLSANVDASVGELSDAGTIHSYSGGFNWQPAKILSFTGNYTVRKTAPTPQQLGDPLVSTDLVPVFDYRRGESVLVTTTTGGNSSLAKAENRNFRIGMSLSPLKDPQLNFQVDLSQNRTKGGIGSLPGVTDATEAAFGSRFVRDPQTAEDILLNRPGRLRSVDFRAINMGEQKSTQLRWGFNLNIQLKTPQSEIRAFQEVARRRIEERIASGQIPPEVAARLRQALASGQFPGQGGRQGGQGQQGQGAGQQGQGGAQQATPAQGQAPQQAQGQQAQGQQGTTGQQAQGQQGQNVPTIVVTGEAAPGTAPQGGTFVFQGPGGGGGNFTPPPGGFRGPPGGFGGGGFGGFGGFGGGGQGGAPRGGRINFSVYHTWVIDSTTQLAPGLPIIDQLDGGTLGGGAGPARHQLQVQAGYTQSGIGFRSFINWNAATRSLGSQSSADLRFGALATVNFRVFVNFQQMPKLVEKVPFLRASRLTFGANNLFDARQKVTNGLGVTPDAYAGAYLDRLGRSISIEFRKLVF